MIGVKRGSPGPGSEEGVPRGWLCRYFALHRHLLPSSSNHAALPSSRGHLRPMTNESLGSSSRMTLRRDHTGGVVKAGEGPRTRGPRCSVFKLPTPLTATLC